MPDHLCFYSKNRLVCSIVLHDLSIIFYGVTEELKKVQAFERPYFTFRINSDIAFGQVMNFFHEQFKGKKNISCSTLSGGKYSPLGRGWMEYIFPDERYVANIRFFKDKNKEINKCSIELYKNDQLIIEIEERSVSNLVQKMGKIFKTGILNKNKFTPTRPSKGSQEFYSQLEEVKNRSLQAR